MANGVHLWSFEKHSLVLSTFEVQKNFVLYITKYKVALHRWNAVVFVATHAYCGMLLFNWNIVCSLDLCFEGWRFILCYY